MKIEDYIKEEDFQNRLDMPIGCELLVRIDGIEAKLKSSLVGYVEGDFLIIRTPRIQHVMSKLFEGNRISVHYMTSGSVRGFQTSIISHILKPVPVMFLAYPSFISSRDLRQGPRANCCLPATIKHEGKEWRGLLINVSAGGCRFVFRQGQKSKPPRLQRSDQLEITFFLSEEVGYLKTEAMVRNKTTVERLQAISMEFYELEEEGYRIISRYVQTVLAHQVDQLQSADL